MQNRNLRFPTRALTVVAAAALVLSFATFAAAQPADVAAIFATAPKQNTNVQGVTVFSGPPKGFNPLAATGVELANYGLPQRPDAQADPRAYKLWERAMLAANTRATGVLPQPFSNREMMGARQRSAAVENTPAEYESNNWSGVASTNKLTKWNNSTSFDYVTSLWNVPVSQPPFGACAAGIKGPFYTSIWNGIDGFSNGDVIQGGSLDIAKCNGKKNGAVSYYGWIEWYPSYATLVITCGSGSTACPVSPGDDFWVITYGTAGTADQTVFIEDLTQQWYGTFALSWISGPGVVGSSAEWIVERSCCSTGSTPYALVNYVDDFFDYSYATNGKGTTFFPGQTTTTTAIITMTDDSGSNDISYPTVGSTGYQGRYSIWFEDESCAYTGGCTP